MQKLNSIKIIQISAAMNDSRGLTCLGLGEDQMVYYWDYTRGSWYLNTLSADSPVVPK